MNQYDSYSELYWERNPYTLRIADNICQLRNWKNYNFLSSSNILSNVEFVIYEELIENPKNFIENINLKYFKQNILFKNVNYYKGIKDEGLYVKKKYPELCESDIEFLKNNLDWKIENKLGYFDYDLFK